jgi:hydroxyacylglutathione hydrolase
LEILSFALTPFVTNCFVLKEGQDALVVDPGDVSPELLEALDGCTVRTVVNTHCHLDHAGGNAALLAHTGAELVCHRAELPLLQDLAGQGRMFGVPVAPSPDPDRFIDEGGTIQVGGMELGVLFTPGHTPGHIVLVGDGFVIGGDVLFAGSIGRTDLPGGDHQQLLESIRTKLLPLPDETTVYCGHGPPTTIGAERASNPFLAGL